jgi:hypothetical protein
LNFGEAWEASAFALELPVTNQSGATVAVSEWAKSCLCLSVDPPQLSLAPGETRPVRVTLDLAANLFDPRAGDPTREFETTLTAVSGDKPVGPKWAIRGTVKNVLGRVPREHDCGLVSDLASEPPAHEFELKPVARLECLSAVVEPPLASATVVPVRADGSHVRVVVRPTLPVPLGEWRATLRLLPVAVGGAALPPGQVKVVVRGGTDVQPYPPTVLLGSIREGETAAEGVEFRSLTGRPFEVMPDGHAPDGGAVEARPDGEGKAFSVSVRGVAGPQTVPVTFRVKQPDRPDYRVEVRLVYHGVK